MPSLLSKSERSYLWQFDQARYRRAYLFGRVPEATVQADIRAALRLLRVDCDWVDSGASAIRGKVWSALMRAKIPEAIAKEIMRAITDVSAADVGRTDLSGVLVRDGAPVPWFIEVKHPAWLNPRTGGVVRPAGIPSPDQLAYMDAKAALGAIVGVAWSVDDALEILGVGGAKPSF